MKMPQEFVDAVNKAVKAVDPNYGHMVSGSMTLGEDFDEWLGPEAMMKYGFGSLPPDEVAAFEAKWAEKKDAIKEELVRSSVDVAKQRLAGTLPSPFKFNDSNRKSV